jgi:methionine synthase II (cobalamin-independent)
MKTRFRADQVGSLLRPRSLLDKRLAFEAGAVSEAALHAAEDEAIKQVLSLQEQIGIDVVSDGEFRRTAWGNGFLDSLEGVTGHPDSVNQTAGRWKGAHSEVATETAPIRRVVTGKVALKEPFTQREARFLKEQAPKPFKITIPSPTMFNRLYDPKLTSGAYESMDALIDDFVEIYLKEMDALHEIGVPYIQLDSLRYIDTIDAVEKGQIKAVDARATLEKLVEIDNRVLGHAKKDGVTRGVHICRGNHRSAWAVTGSYESVAEMLLGKVDTDRFLLEFDSERAGGFEPLRFVPKDKVVVLGLVTTKSPELENIDDLRRRVDEASKYVPLENLAISPQCGFASTHLGNLLTEDDEKRKLELVAKTAREIWG